MQTINKPTAVLISDVHYNLQTLPLADAAMRQVITKANELQVPLIVAGDVHDTKANLRAECVNAMIETFKELDTIAYVLVGNHDKTNEKSTDNALNFLAAANTLIFIGPEKIPGKFNLIPYQSDPATFKKALIPKYINIAHQGLSGTNSGEYIQDRTAITPNDAAGLRVISGHYHTRQTINLPDGGKWDYIGNPYTLNFAEANDPEKGYQILYSDGSLEFVPTNLRKHVIYTNLYTPIKHSAQDLVWVKLDGTKEELAKINKAYAAEALRIMQPFKFDKIEIQSNFQSDMEATMKSLTKAEHLDLLIDINEDISKDRKEVLKSLWKAL